MNHKIRFSTQAAFLAFLREVDLTWYDAEAVDLQIAVVCKSLPHEILVAAERNGGWLDPSTA